MNDPIIFRARHNVIFTLETYDPLPQIGGIESPIEYPFEDIGIGD